MGVGYNTKVVKDNLLFYLDAENPKCYPGSGSKVYDLSNNQSSITMYNSIAIDSSAGKPAFNFNSVGKYLEGTINGTMPTTNATIEVWIYPASSEVSSGDRGTLVLFKGGSQLYHSFNKSNLKLSNYWYNHPSAGYHESNIALTRENWYCLTAVWDYTNSKIIQWVNLNKTSVSGVSGNNIAGSTLNIGRESNGRQFSGWISVVKIYNSALTDEEVIANFEALRGRYGI